MGISALQIYHRLPFRMKEWVASLRGAQLKRWRFGMESDRLIGEALLREHWSFEAWQQWENTRLVSLLDHAARSVPYYRKHWEKDLCRGGQHAPWRELRNWPVLEKMELRRNNLQFLQDGADRSRMFEEHTSGTTSTPLHVWWSRDAVQLTYAVFEARVRLWNGVSRHSRWAVMGGQLIMPVEHREPPFWVWNSALSQLYLSSYHLAPDLIPYYLDAIAKHRVEYIFGYCSSLYALAQGIIASGRTDIRMRVAITNAEPLFDYQRDAIGRAFQCPVRETYGNSEGVSHASECEAGKRHFWPELGTVEVLDGLTSLPDGNVGDLVFTGVFNPMMPLIRYRIGDRGSIQRGVRCECGRTLPILETVEGRKDDVLVTADGRLIGRLDPIFKADLPVVEAQVVQESLRHIRIRYVPELAYKPADGERMIVRLRERMGDVQVTLEAVDKVPREKGGKFRAVISKLSPEERSKAGIQHG